MQREILFIEDALFFVTGQFGCSTTDEALFNEDGEWVDADAPHRYLVSRSFKGWNEQCHLFCSECGDTIVGTPRRILIENWCPCCESTLYDNDDKRWLEKLGFELYRQRVTRFQELSVNNYIQFVDTRTLSDPQGQDVSDAVVQHLYPVRNGFEDQVDETIIGSPMNLRMVAFADSFNKRHQSLPSLAKLVNRYSAFVATKPEWLENAERLDGGIAAAAMHTAEARFVEVL